MTEFCPGMCKPTSENYPFPAQIGILHGNLVLLVLHWLMQISWPASACFWVFSQRSSYITQPGGLPSSPIQVVRGAFMSYTHRAPVASGWPGAQPMISTLCKRPQLYRNVCWATGEPLDTCMDFLGRNSWWEAGQGAPQSYPTEGRIHLQVLLGSASPGTTRMVSGSHSTSAEEPSWATHGPAAATEAHGEPLLFSLLQVILLHTSNYLSCLWLTPVLSWFSAFIIRFLRTPSPRTNRTLNVCQVWAKTL